MPSIVKTLKVVADPNRLRILLLLKGEELSVAELQEILAMGQSTISTHLSQLKQAELVEDRRTGKSNLYRLAAPAAEADGVLKGHGFSRAVHGPTEAGPLGPEGRNFFDNLLARAAIRNPRSRTGSGRHAPRAQKAPGQNARLL